MPNSFIVAKRPSLLFLGPTAVGKTSLLLEYFAQGTVEVLNIDLIQMYRHFSIASAKPSLLERQHLVHHFVDTLEPFEILSLGDFVPRAWKLFFQRREKGQSLIVSGGTPYYLKHLLWGIPQTPAVDPAIREELREAQKRNGLAVLYQKLKDLDPLSAERISPRDSYRILRALEVYQQTGKRLSSFSSVDPQQSQALANHLDLRIALWRSSDEMQKRVKSRVADFVKKGLFDEIRFILKQRYETSPAMKGIAYQEFLFWQKHALYTWPQIEELIVNNTLRYVKKQMKFLRTFQGLRWFHPQEDRHALHRLLKDFASS